jgi:hypothetical protein
MIGIFELLILIIVFGPGLIAILDILKNDFKGNNKIIWLLTVILVPIIGAIFYFFIGRNQKVKNRN